MWEMLKVSTRSVARLSVLAGALLLSACGGGAPAGGAATDAVASASFALDSTQAPVIPATSHLSIVPVLTYTPEGEVFLTLHVGDDSSPDPIPAHPRGQGGNPGQPPSSTGTSGTSTTAK